MWSTIFIVIICSLVGINQAVAEKGATVTKLECIHNEGLCLNMICTMTHVTQFVTNSTIGCTLAYPVPKLMVRVTNYVKLKSNKYKKNLNDYTFDYCQFYDGVDNPMLKTFYSNIRNMMGDLYRPCPISGTVIGKNMTYDGSTAIFWGRPLGYRIDVTIMTGRFVNIIKVMIYGEIINDEKSG